MVHRLLTAVASLAVEHGVCVLAVYALVVAEHRLGGVWNLPDPGIEPVSLALEGGFLLTVPPRKFSHCFILLF